MLLWHVGEDFVVVFVLCFGVLCAYPVTSAKEVMFYLVFVCSFFCLSAC